MSWTSRGFPASSEGLQEPSDQGLRSGSPAEPHGSALASESGVLPEAAVKESICGDDPP